VSGTGKVEKGKLKVERKIASGFALFPSPIAHRPSSLVRGAMVPWWRGAKVQWLSGAMVRDLSWLRPFPFADRPSSFIFVERCHGAMVQWWRGAMVRWWRGAMVR
jgi:hypothetical protein